MLASWSIDPIDEDAVRTALRSILWVVCPTLFALALVASRIEDPGAVRAALSILLAAIGLTGLAVWWWRRPPQHAHRAAALSIAILQVSLVGQLLAIPDPVVATQQIILAVGTAFFLIDLRWMLAVQAFGIACWLAATGLAEPTPQWQFARLATLAGYGAAGAFYLGRVRAMERIRQLTRESHGLDQKVQKSDRALRASDTRLRNAQRIAHVGSFEWDIEAHELHWSDEQYRIFGWEPGEVEIDNALFMERVHPDDRDAMVQAVTDSFGDGTPVELVFRVVRANGEQRVILGRSETYRDEAGKLISHVGTSYDITDRHEVEEALRENEGRLLAILTAMDAERAVVVSRDGTVRSILGEPPERTGRYGISADKVVGRAIHDLLPGEAGDRMVEAVQEVYTTGDRAEVEASVEFPTGTFHFDVSLRALRSGSGEIESVLAIVRDMTQRKADALALRQAQKLESLGVLAGGVAHDFNNLLVGVLGNAEMSLDELDPLSPLQPALKDIVRASTRAAELTQALLAYVGTAKLEAKPFDLAVLVEETAELVRPALAKGVGVELDRNSEPAWIHADTTQIRQVVMNFITNAADAMKAQGGRVRVRTDVVEMDRQALERCTIPGAKEPGEYCRFSVLDRGVGMEGETLDKIFDPFFTTKFQGRGLGLASTVGIVRAHGGAIQVESEPGLGSTFILLLPRVAPVPATPNEPGPNTSAGRGTILVVDDEDLVRQMTRRALESKGYRVLGASSGSRAVEILEQTGSVDLALVDLTMPEMDGEQTFVALRAIDSRLPVLFMSGHSRNDIALRVAGKERTSHLMKPFRISALNQAVLTLLEHARD